MIQHWLTQYCFCDSTGSLEGVERLLRVSCQLWPRMPHLSLPARLGSYWVSFRCAPLGQNKGAWGLASLSQGGRPKLCHYHRAKAWGPFYRTACFSSPNTGAHRTNCPALTGNTDGANRVYRDPFTHLLIYLLNMLLCYLLPYVLPSRDQKRKKRHYKRKEYFYCICYLNKIIKF